MPPFAFYKACRGGDLATVMNALSADDPSARPSTEELAKGLLSATTERHYEVISLLLANGASIPDGLPLSMADNLTGDPSLLRVFLEHGLNPNTPLIVSHMVHHMGSLLGYDTLRHPGRLDIKLKQKHRICKDIECTKLLLQHGADPNLAGRIRDWHKPRDATPLEGALFYGNLEIAELLLASGAKLLPDHLFALMAPRVSGTEEKVRWVLRNGIDVNTPHPEYGTALHYVVRYHKLGHLKLLLDEGADPLARPQVPHWAGMTPRELLESREEDQAAHERNKEYRELLLAAEAKVTGVGKVGE